MIGVKSISKRRLLDFLDLLDGKSGDCLTVYLAPSLLPHRITELGMETSLAGEIGDLLNQEAIQRERERYRTGAVLFWTQSEDKLLVIPPFPVPESALLKGKPETSLLRQLLERERTLGVILVTWGWYAIGVFAGGELADSKVGTGHIHPRHRKGGSSQKRFARRTEEQKRDFLRRVSGHIEEKLQQYNLERIFFGGNRLILKPLCEAGHYLNPKRIEPRLLNVRHANREALFGSLEEINKSVVFEVAP